MVGMSPDSRRSTPLNSPPAAPDEPAPRAREVLRGWQDLLDCGGGLVAVEILTTRLSRRSMPAVDDLDCADMRAQEGLGTRASVWSAAAPNAVPRPSWRSEANCAGADVQLFFADQSRLIARAKQICRDCAVQRDCLCHALQVGADGIWGGLTARERGRLPVRGADGNSHADRVR
jgi:WhiB family redox-sensing transcriptional regulator